MGEKETIEQIRLGDKEAIKSVYKDNVKDVYSFVKTIVDDHDTAMDVTKTTFVKLFSGIREGNEPVNIRLEVLKVAYDEACRIKLPSSEIVDSPFDRDVKEQETAEETPQKTAADETVQEPAAETVPQEAAADDASQMTPAEENAENADSPDTAASGDPQDAAGAGQEALPADDEALQEKIKDAASQVTAAEGGGSGEEPGDASFDITIEFDDIPEEASDDLTEGSPGPEEPAEYEKVPEPDEDTGDRSGERRTCENGRKEKTSAKKEKNKVREGDGSDKEKDINIEKSKASGKLELDDDIFAGDIHEEDITAANMEISADDFEDDEEPDRIIRPVSETQVIDISFDPEDVSFEEQEYYEEDDGFDDDGEDWDDDGCDEDEDDEKPRRGGAFVFLIILNVVLVLILLWLLGGLLVNLGILPESLDLGYTWFNENIYPIF